MRLIACAAILFATAASALAQNTPTDAIPSNTPWEYTGGRGPLVWGKLDPAYSACSKGHEQSPVDIHGAHLNKALQPIEFHYIGGSVTLENNGHTIVANVNPGSYIVAGGTRYDLLQFHFHTPSEEAVNGKLTDMVVHLVHKSADGKIAQIAVRFAQERGTPNAVMAMLWPHLPKAKGATEKVTDMVNPGGFLPRDRGYWTYIGSATTPPCTEGVRWFVFENEISMSLDELRLFQSIFKMNSRPLQDLHGRRIEANE
jgi:carbonic anhydrase